MKTRWHAWHDDGRCTQVRAKREALDGGREAIDEAMEAFDESDINKVSVEEIETCT